MMVSFTFLKDLYNKSSKVQVEQRINKKPINPMLDELENEKMLSRELKNLVNNNKIAKNKIPENESKETAPIVMIHQHGSDYSIDLYNLTCSCGASFDKNFIPDFRNMCCHMTVAITKYRFKFSTILKPFKKFFGAIEQHAASNTVQNMPALKGKYYFKSKKHKATLFQADYSSDRDHEFIRVMIRGRNYSLWLPGLVWCQNGDMYAFPLDQELKTLLTEFILNNMPHDLCCIPSEIQLDDIETTNNRIVGVCATQGNKFKITHIIKPDKNELRFNLKIGGWREVKGTGVVRYIPNKDKIMFAQRCDKSISALLEPHLLPWLRYVYDKFYKS